MTEPHTVVILGASIGGLPIAHYLMKHSVPAMKTLKVVLVSPNKDFFWCLASVRGILPNMLPEDKLFYPIAALFEKYPEDQFEFVVGKAERLDPSKQLILVSVTDDSSRELHYDTLIIATGSAAKGGMPFKNLESTDKTKMSIQRWQQEIKLAKSIVIAGAGQTGSEVAGELGEEYASKGLKEITLVVKDDLPLSPPVRDNVRRAVKSSLEKLKVHVIRASQVTSVCQSGVGGGKILEITNQNGNKMTVEVDVYIPAFGTVPNSHFAPAHMLDASNRFKQTLDLRADGYENIFVIGDVGNLQTPNAKHVDDQVIQLSKILPAYLNGLELPKYVPDNSIVFAVSLGKGGGTGQLKSVKLFSLAVWLLKSRYLGTNYASELAAGNRTMQSSSW
ncbi:hypothetical protein BFJ66_g10714 [Fusarium oxysporum f. sp. cepae]|nr:hypothetical protein BFJ66_g10714 [Fusarium oxysporum f. sp. cepae]